MARRLHEYNDESNGYRSFPALDLYRSPAYRDVGTTVDPPVGFTRTFQKEV